MRLSARDLSFECDHLTSLLGECKLDDESRFLKQIQGIARNTRSGSGIEEELDALHAQITASMAEVRLRHSIPLRVEFPSSLPITSAKREITEKITENQVLVLSGATGSGKSTQLPKLLLELGYGTRGRIGHTQPRRLAARSLARRLADEIGSDCAVGYKVRFHDQVKPETRVKFLTDGMLLAEIQSDRDLLQYDALIIDEAHERSLNIDFLLGYIHQLLPRRPELKVVITSATIDPQRFAEHFSDAAMLEVSGRGFPVDVRYRPVGGNLEADATESKLHAPSFGERDEETQQAIVEAVDELAAEDRGDILIFLSGEREIRETADTLRKHKMPPTEILPLYARLGIAEQARVFRVSNVRRIVLSTNVAETSLTVPGIRHVIDTGFARISRYSFRSKVQRLPVEPISRASADQRKGRCGREAEGICIRLYSEDNYLARAEFTEPEIQRTNLAAVILQMKTLGFGDLQRFPFVDPPDRRQIRDGYRVLEEIGAFDHRHDLTPIGRRIARLPVDPRLGRMLLEASVRRCLEYVLVIVAALGVQDARDRPPDKQEAADQAHKRYRQQGSDFLAYLRLWRTLEYQRKHLSRSQFRAFCRNQFLSWSRVQEWHDSQRQLRAQLHEMGLASQVGPMPMFDPEQESERLDIELQGHSDEIHRSILSGLLSHVGQRDKATKGEYRGPRNLRFHLFPGSSLFRADANWVMSAELVETQRLYARTVAAIQPGWIEELAGHLLKRSYSEPHWQRKSAQVAAYERVTLHGLVLTARRKINFGPVDPPRSVRESHQIFIQRALVDGDFHTRAPFWRHNRQLIAGIRDLEARMRRRDLLVDEQQIYDFYFARVPQEIYSGASFETWLKKVSRTQPRLLHMTEGVLLSAEVLRNEQDFPDSLDLNGMRLPLEYRFDPTHPADGLTLRIPAAVLNQLDETTAEWLVPGLRQERVVALLRALPKSYRKALVPIPETASDCLKMMAPGRYGLFQSLSRAIRELRGVQIPESVWDETDLPKHLRMNLEVIDETGQPLAQGRDLGQLKRQFAGEADKPYHQLDAKTFERDDIRTWDFGDLPDRVETRVGSMKLIGYPALVDKGDRVSLKLVDSETTAAVVHRGGMRRLIMLALASDMRYLRRNLGDLKTLRLQYARVPPPSEGQAQEIPSDIDVELIARVIDSTFLENGRTPKTPLEFSALIEANKGQLMPHANQLVRLVTRLLQIHQQLRHQLDTAEQTLWKESVDDMRAQLDRLVFRGFLTTTPSEQLAHLERYLHGIERRLGKLTHALARDIDLMSQMRPIQQAWLAFDERLRRERRTDVRREEIFWWIEELRVSLFAQELGTARRVSVPRVQRRWDELGL